MFSSFLAHLPGNDLDALSGSLLAVKASRWQTLGDERRCILLLKSEMNIWWGYKSLHQCQTAPQWENNSSASVETSSDLIRFPRKVSTKVWILQTRRQEHFLQQQTPERLGVVFIWSYKEKGTNSLCFGWCIPLTVPAHFNKALLLYLIKLSLAHGGWIQSQRSAGQPASTFTTSACSCSALHTSSASDARWLQTCWRK